MPRAFKTPEERKAKDKVTSTIYRKAHLKECSARVLAHYHQNKEAISVKRKVTYLANREKMRVRERAYQENNRDAICKRGRDRYAKKRAERIAAVEAAEVARLDIIDQIKKLRAEFVEQIQHLQSQLTIKIEAGIV